MKIRDIVNRDHITLTNCEHEPIHIPGSIQPHGFLLGIRESDWKIDFCSGNVIGFLGFPHQQVLGKTFREIFGDNCSDVIKKYYESPGFHTATPVHVILFDREFGCTIHNSNGIYILEFEPYRPDRDKLIDAYTQTIQFVSYMNNTSTLKELCALVADGTREITGYDRVMVYRFDQEYNGEVFAESCREDLEPFLGLHYPHTDIPVQARQLYMKNLLRLIVDVNYKPTPIYTIDDASNKNLDLSLSTLRSTSPIHAEYLNNMGVGATLTISLIHRDRLWGLIACHHYSPKNLTPEIKLAAQLQGQFITSQIDVRQSNEEYEIARKTNVALEKLNSFNLPPVSESFKIISISPDLLKLCNATGVSICIGDKIYKNGITPPDNDIVLLSKWFLGYSNDSFFHTDKLVNFIPDLGRICVYVSGVICHSLSSGNSIIWYRPETHTEVHWGGDPNKAIIRDSNGLHPRNSFNLWKQIVKNRSNPWLQPELNAAANYAHSLQKQISMKLLSDEEEKYRNLNEILKETNAELENINWISTHDLQEPLRKIQLIGSRLLSKEDENFSATAIDGLTRIQTSANRMQTLLVDILKYTRIKHTEAAFETADLDAILNETLGELKEMLMEKNASISHDTLPEVTGIPFLLKQLFSNILLNSLKYAADERPAEIVITASENPQPAPVMRNRMCWKISFSDNGIGFDPQYADNIFNIFTRLHAHAEYKGSGVGLALCRKIMQTHGGHITAEGQPDNGATVTLYFPCDFNGQTSV